MHQSYLNYRIENFKIPIEQTSEGKFALIHPNWKPEADTEEGLITKIHMFIRERLASKSIMEIDHFFDNFHKK
ncbi:MAG TPA: hypothetical protein VGW78_02405 [Candidatus Babeliales bacterium]|nr:hypothetical protein [Candidatus Babeliales bacterium]